MPDSSPRMLRKLVVSGHGFKFFGKHVFLSPALAVALVPFWNRIFRRSVLSCAIDGEPTASCRAKSAEIPIDNLAICDSIGCMLANRTRRPLDVVCQSTLGRQSATASRHTNRDLRKIVLGCLNGVTPKSHWGNAVENSALPRGNLGVTPWKFWR